MVKKLCSGPIGNAKSKLLELMRRNSPGSFSFVEPIMALRVPELPAGDWIYEVKFDGYRALAFKAGSEVRLLSRNRTLFNDNYPVLIEALKSYPS
jgi:bifunctional non-homologous end joining protein LigD